MATQSLYRRYRPRRFGELRGQEHVVRALRDSIANDRVGQAYLFSGPRGTGKTTTARIMAKALNCENVQGGEPCCECDSCLSVENGTSYDVHELDAASNNGVDSIRDLIEKASLGTPGRHKVYILDEVHMLSKGAEAALLKTLEEPPPHVVFVLATTDPQKMSDTIRSRTQHLQFHLLPADELSDHVRWVASDAGLDLDDAAFAAALERGGGSARDTLSALELLASTGGSVGDATDVDAVIAALVARDPAGALGAVATGVSLGLDPRTMTEDIVRHLRNGFLTLMSPDLVSLAPERVASLTETAREYGAAGLVRAIERLGSVLTDMRNAPDPRILLEVALVQLTSDEADGDVAALARRLQRLEQQLASVGTGSNAAPSVTDAAAAVVTPSVDAQPAQRDPETGRKVLGGAAQRAREAAERASGRGSTPSESTEPSGATGGAAHDQATPAPVADAAPSPDDQAADQHQPAADRQVEQPVERTSEDQPTERPAGEQPDRDSNAEATPGGTTGATSAATGGVVEQWAGVRSSLKPLVRALYSAGDMSEPAPGTALFQVTTPAQAAKCEEHKTTVESALAAAVGGPITLEIRSGSQPSEPSRPNDSTPPSQPSGSPNPRSDDQASGDRDSGEQASGDRAQAGSGDQRTERDDASTGTTNTAGADGAAMSAAQEVAETPPTPPIDDEEPEPVEYQREDEIDLDELVDAPPDSYRTPLDHLQEAFPGSRMITDDER